MPDASKDYARVTVAQLENVPQELRSLPQWVCWRAIKRDETKTAKVPLDPRPGGKEASVSAPRTWGTFPEALARVKADKTVNGVGFVFISADPYTGIDIDDCRDPVTGALGDWALEIIKSLKSYTEVSPSGTGVKIIVKAEVPGPASRRNKIEMYSHSRYFTITGNVLPDAPVTVEERQGELADLYQLVFGSLAQDAPEAPATPSVDVKLARVRQISDEELLTKARNAANGEKFERLWSGDASDMAGDKSRADASLCAILGYWTRSDAARIDKLFRLSKLYRAKWDERRGEKTYGERTVAHAVNGATALYDPDTDTAVSTRHNDIANAEIFIQLYGDRYVHCAPWKNWLIWNDVYWSRDADTSMGIAAERVSLELERRCAGLTGPELTRELKWATSVGDVYRMNQLENIAKRRLGVMPEKFDQPPFLFCCTNGVIDLLTGELRDGSRDDWLTRHTDARYDKKAKCPTWDKFLLEIMEGDKEMVSYLWRVLGYTLTGDTSERSFFVLHGWGRNGKTTFVETIQALLGSTGHGYAQKAKFSTFLRKNITSSGANDDVAHLMGARAVLASESDQSIPLDVSLVKELTGSDTVRARFLYGREFQFKPFFKLFLATNHIPPIYESTYSIWDRLHYVEFKYRVPDSKIDKGLQLKLLGELEGILNKAVRACLEWQREGLCPPDKVLKAREALYQNMDTFGQFISETCEVEGNARITHAALTSAFGYWAKDQGMRKWPSGQALASYLKQKGYLEQKSPEGTKMWTGLKLKPRGHSGAIDDTM